MPLSTVETLNDLLDLQKFLLVITVVFSYGTGDGALETLFELADTHITNRLCDQLYIASLAIFDITQRTVDMFDLLDDLPTLAVERILQYDNMLHHLLFKQLLKTLTPAWQIIPSQFCEFFAEFSCRFHSSIELFGDNRKSIDKCLHLCHHLLSDTADAFVQTIDLVRHRLPHERCLRRNRRQCQLLRLYRSDIVADLFRMQLQSLTVLHNRQNPLPILFIPLYLRLQLPQLSPQQVDALQYFTAKLLTLFELRLEGFEQIRTLLKLPFLSLQSLNSMRNIVPVYRFVGFKGEQVP